MLALQKTADAPGLTWTTEAPIPRPGPGEVRIAVTHAGICGTDRHIFEWDDWSRGRVPLGITIGHEFVGRVVEVGPGVTRTRIGTRVSAEGHVGCGICRPCRTGRAHICDRVDILGIDRNGGFAQHVVVPEVNLWPVHPDISDPVAALFDPLGNAMHTVMAAGVSGKSVLITGVGTIGLMAVSIARAAGATKILVTDVDARRLARAEQLGADVALSAGDDDWPQEARRRTAGDGPDVLLEMSGHPDAIRQGLGALAGGGTAALLGLPAQPVPLDLPRDVIFKGITLLGINGRRMFETWYQVESFLLGRQIDPAPLITHQLPLADFKRGFALMQSGEAIKVVLEVPQEEEAPSCRTAASTTAPRNS